MSVLGINRELSRGAMAGIIFSLAIAFLAVGCRSSSRPPREAASARAPAPSEPVRIQSNVPDDERTPILVEGFVVGVSFPGAPNLNTSQQIRPDGKIALPLIGELEIVGLTPLQLEEKLMELYKSQLVSNQVSVTLISAQFPVSVNGAVSRSGEMMLDRPTTVFELVMKAGVDMQRANLGRVAVIRRENGEPKRFELNLQLVLDGKDSGLFFLKPGDAVYVPIRVI